MTVQSSSASMGRALTSLLAVSASLMLLSLIVFCLSRPTPDQAVRTFALLAESTHRSSAGADSVEQIDEPSRDSDLGEHPTSPQPARHVLTSDGEVAEALDPVALIELGRWHLDQGDPRTAVAHLRRAHEQWSLLGIPQDQDAGEGTAEYYWGLLELWKAERDPLVALAAFPLEEQALREARRGEAKELTCLVLFNSACLRVLMIRAGALDPVDGIHAIELLHRAFDSAGDYSTAVAEGVLFDPDLDGLRALPAFEGLASKASSFLARTKELAAKTDK